ncbi:MAG TPA: PD-(D/E)XK nuclease family protein [Vicinamibacterales bacterium]|nr:PD-(D/E)XK nuclease family protein [Vicinamibacterales bacterium]
MSKSRGTPFIWVTWLTPILSADAQCEWAPWFKAHYTYDKIERNDFDLERWKVEHAAMVDARAAQLRAEGYIVFVEDQNQFRLKGQSATLSGKPDILAVRPDKALVVDCKSGKRRGSDIHQVLFYLLALPLSHASLSGQPLHGEVQYRDGSVHISPEEFTGIVRERMVELIKRLGSGEPPRRVPSARECAFCDIGSTDCPDRIESSVADIAVPELF